MNETPLATSLSHMDQSIAQTQLALKSLEIPAQESADAIDLAFSKAGQSLAKSLGRAAADGKITMRELASAVIAAFEAAQSGSNPSTGLGGVLSQILKGASSVFSGARADGGMVNAGGAYLVGERGPELFRPASSGSIESNSSLATQISVTLNLSGGTQNLIRSEAQIASALSRAARLGVR